MQSRITITIPADLIQAADTKAQSLSRSRSWVLVEALREYLAAPRSDHGVGEPVAHPYAASRAAPTVDAAAEVAASRQRRLRAEARLPELERLRRAEELAQLGRRTDHAGASAQIVGFDTYEDYYEWKRNRLIRI